MRIFAIYGPTASGKSALAERLADHLDAQLLNADAFQVYRGMDIGTAKPENRSRYELLDLVNPNEQFGIGEYVRHASHILFELEREGQDAILVGGTGFYLRALLDQYSEMAGLPDPALRERLQAAPFQELVHELRQRDPKGASQTDLKNPLRVRRALERLDSEPFQHPGLPEAQIIKVGISMAKPELDARIDSRVDDMLARGWRTEVDNLLKGGYQITDPGFRAIGYRTLAEHGTDVLDANLALLIASQTKKYAKRQKTWLRTERNLRKIESEQLSDWESCLAVILGDVTDG